MSSEKKASDASDLKKQTPSQMKSTPNMVSVVEEQSNDESIVHILPRAPMMEYSSSAATATDLDGEKMITGDTLKSVKNSANFTSNSELDRSKDSDKDALFDTSKLKSMSSMPDDANINLSLSEKIDAIHKKTIDPTRVVLKSVTDMKLKKATNPSISSLRAMSIQNNNNLNNLHPNSNNSSNFNSINHNNNNNNNNSNLNSNIPSNNNITSNNINNTVSSSSTTLTKGSTRAEIFAAKLHDAIKNDTNLNNDTVETFVYDTTTSNTTPMVESNYEHLEQYRNDESDQTKTSSRDTEFKEPTNVERRTNSDGRSSINHFSNIQPVKEKLQNVFKNEPESPLSRKTIEDNFEVKSKSSMGSRRNSKRKPSRTFGDFTELHPKQKLEGDDNKSVNQLRQITSRLFDNKSIQLHKYSNNDDEFTNNDSFEDEMDYFDDSSYANYNYGNHNNNTQHHQPNTPTAFNYNKGSYSQPNPQSGNQYEVLYSNTDLDGLDDEELQSYLSTNYHSVNTGKSTYLGKPQHNFQEPNHHQLNHHNYLQQQQQQQQQQHLNPNLQQPLHSNIFSLPDYGSVIPDKKRRFWRTKDIYSSPHDFTSLRTQRIKQLKSFCYSVSIILLLLFLGFISGFILATNKELQDLEVLDIRNTIVSQEELVFDMVFSAFNPSLISIKVDTAQLDVFAKTKYAFSQKGDNTPYETILLGTIDTLEVPLIFEGGFLNRKKDRGSTQFKIVNPCSLDNENVHKNKDKDKDILSQRVQLYGDKADDELEKSSFLQNIIEFNTPDDRWLNISRHPFDIIVRGALMYKLPLSSDNHTVSVSYTSYIDPHDDFID